jgi:hypothetical protein
LRRVDVGQESKINKPVHIDGGQAANAQKILGSELSLSPTEQAELWRSPHHTYLTIHPVDEGFKNDSALLRQALPNLIHDQTQIQRPQGVIQLKRNGTRTLAESACRDSSKKLKLPKPQVSVHGT